MNDALGIIDPAKIYTLKSIQAASGLGAWAFKTLRREHDLRILRFGGRAFVKGSDFIAAIESAAEATAE